MIRKNDHLRKQINERLKIQVNERVKIEQKQNSSTSSHPSHTLLLSIGQYRKQITSLAIDCLKQHQSQSVSLARLEKTKHKSIHLNEQNQPIRQINKSKLLDQHNKTPQTKKKKYNYCIGLQNESTFLLGAQKSINGKYETIGLDRLNMLNKDHVRNCKSYSLINQKHHNYITTPFVVDSQQNQSKPNERPQIQNQKPTQFEKVHLLNAPYSSNHSTLGANQRTLTQKANQTIQNKSSHNQHQCKPSKSSKTLLIPTHQPLIYPKTETYTSRSDYNIEKLKNKLDSYIKKHIN